MSFAAMMAAVVEPSTSGGSEVGRLKSTSQKNHHFIARDDHLTGGEVLIASRVT